MSLEIQLSISMRQSDLARCQKVIADLQKSLADEFKKEAAKTGDCNRIERSISKSTPLSSIQSKQQQISRIMDDIANIQKKKSDISRKLADQSDKLHKAQQAIAKEEDAERKKIYESEKKRKEKRNS